ncbi:MAG: hypothetical protein WC082_11780, partial [Victivallales bacterium]
EELFKAKKYKEALPYLVRAASRKNDAGAQFYLGAIYQLGLGTEKNYKRAKYWYRRSFEQGNVSSAVNLGNMLRQGNGFKKPNPERAVQFYKWAKDKGNDSAKFNYALAYYTGNGLEKDYKKAFEIFMPLARKGNPKAQMKVAYMYFKGLVVPPDENEALRWYYRAAKNGESSGYYAIARIGIDIKEMELAEKCLKKAAESGISGAKIDLACLSIRKDKITEEEKEKALKYLMSIDKNDSNYGTAQSLIKAIHAAEQGIKPDNATAAVFFKSIADIGDEMAPVYYAYILVSEQRNLDEAALYIRKALKGKWTDSDYLYIYGYILYSQGKYKEALREYQKGDRFSQEPLFKIKKGIGYAYLALGEDDKALKAWSEALSIPESDEKLKSKIVSNYIMTVMKQRRKISILTQNP